MTLRWPWVSRILHESVVYHLEQELVAVRAQRDMHAQMACVALYKLQEHEERDEAELKRTCWVAPVKGPSDAEE